MPERSFHRSLRGHGRVRRSLSIAAVVLLVAMPLVALASHQFTDVPDSNIFHADISTMVDAGITTGCGGGKYCPADPVTRGQMAAFLNRGLGRASVGYSSVSFADSATTAVASLDFKAGGAAGGTGFVTVSGDVTAYTNEAGVCPCEIEIFLWNDTTAEFSNSIFFDISNTATPSGYRNSAGSVSWVFPVDTGSTTTFALSANVTSTNAPATGDSTIEGAITAIYTPYGVTGGVAASTSGPSLRSPHPVKKRLTK